MTISYSILPQSARSSMQLYVERGIPTGSFLERILCNDLVGAAQHADDCNMHLLLPYAQWLSSDAPNACWGSIEIVNEWIKHNGMEGFSENADG